ncbi:MAG: IS30 family transposase, partial [Clostridia bacterium]|nr:IS30 family transposase [Clostridia bacterium]
SDLNTMVYFAHPHSPWERPSNENTNGLLRQFIPKHRDLGNMTDDELSRFVALINLRPRKCLNWSTPYEVFSDQLLHLT